MDGDSRAGEITFARYAYPPNELGYCGPGDPGRVFDVAVGRSSPGDDFGARARAFDGAWVYLQIIAAAAGLDDPLDARVVEAYWVGNELLDRVDPAAFAEQARARFAGQVGAHWAVLDQGGLDQGGLEQGGLDTAGQYPSVPHHGFQVFTVYPWVRLLGRGDAALTALNVLDRCRIRWARITSVEGEYLDVLGSPLSWDGRELGLGPERGERVRWARDGRAPLPDLAVGDWVSLHWDWTCDRLGPGQLLQLRERTLRQLAATNRALDRACADGGDRPMQSADQFGPGD